MARTLAAASAAHRHTPAGKGLVARLLAWDALFRQRTRLADLDPALLADVGLTADEARREASRPVWDAPAYWHR